MPKDIDLLEFAAALGGSDEIKQLVLVFNNIPRSYMLSDGRHANHWHFAVRNITAGHVLHIVNPDSRATYTSRPVDVFSKETVECQAGFVFGLLLKTFVESICNSFTPPTAPWSWGTQDEVSHPSPVACHSSGVACRSNPRKLTWISGILSNTIFLAQSLAKTVGTIMVAANVRKALCRISFGDEENSNIEQEVWTAEQERLRLVATIGCRRCKRLPQSGQTFSRCSGCKEVQYCSTDCQRDDWKEHKKFCQILRIASSETWSGTTSTEAALDGLTYHTRNWATAPDVQALAKKMGLKLPVKHVR